MAASTVMCSLAWWPASMSTSGSASSVLTLSLTLAAHRSRPSKLRPMLMIDTMSGWAAAMAVIMACVSA